MGLVLRVLKFLVTGVLAFLLVAIGVLLYLRIPQNAAGMAALKGSNFRSGRSIRLASCVRRDRFTGPSTR